ncbi:hypothetical protein MAPG_11835 [Magnaporthiopsis poae ATCC 64411]|uniref:TLDc domain-containing protein n=1 Tax=Magnaporthiopsis poae (strain ATCC 64411 / 73-15) TaxID=644358 RepID=A0A0C4EGA6_MAGP6|nr:hypothetical protein MAPG_11835 [Magnaporthiopsis poae ATCC 64411]
MRPRHVLQASTWLGLRLLAAAVVHRGFSTNRRLISRSPENHSPATITGSVMASQNNAILILSDSEFEDELEGGRSDTSFPQGSGLITQDLANKLLEDEAQAIDDLYRPGERVAKPCCPETGQHPGVDRIMDCCAKFGSVSLGSATLHEGQERELSPKIEQERHVEKPKPAEPAPHRIDAAVLHFVRTGKIPAFSASQYFPSAWNSLARTSAAAAIGLSVHEFPHDVRATRDFASTIQTSSNSTLGAKSQLDQYQRAVRWILTSTSGDLSDVVRTMVLISPFEAQGLLEEIVAHRNVVLHLYAPRSTISLAPLDHLLLHARPTPPPTWTCPLKLKAQLNVFSGQLFILSYNEYKAICETFGLDWAGGLGDGVFVHTDGFIDPFSREGDGTDGEACAFTQSPVPFVSDSLDFLDVTFILC